MPSKQRFEVDTAGMAALHEGRAPWSLIKELVANAWDENATLCDVQVRNAPHGSVHVVVEDNGPGFADIVDSWTLMRHTEKRGKPNVRGRFNLGEKEIISIAEWAIVDTVGWTVEFPKGGGREVKRNDRERGTTITLAVKWNHTLTDQTVGMLRMFLPPSGVAYRVNGEPVEARTPDRTFEAKSIETVLQDGPNQPLRPTYRNTEVRLHVAEGAPWLYEMGIPVQRINGRYHIDVQQKIPVPPNRDSVRESWMRAMYAEVLGHTADELPNGEAGAAWVAAALEDKRTTPGTAHVVMVKRYGPKAAMWSSDRAANERAIGAGYHLVTPQSLPRRTRELFFEAGMPKAGGPGGLFSTDITHAEAVVKLSDDMQAFGRYAKWLARHLLSRDDLRVDFRAWESSVAATYGHGVLTLNVQNLGEHWFAAPGREEHTALILHELAHEGDSPTLPHHGSYIDRLAELGAKAVALARSSAWWLPTDD